MVDTQEAKVPKPLTELESRVLDYLYEYLRLNTYQPSIREIGSEFAIKSTKSVSELLQSLADKGWIERDPSRSRGVRLLGLEQAPDIVAVPLLEGAAADTTTGLVLDRSLAGGHGTFLVGMLGNHLLEEGIRTGDLLIVTPIAADRLQTGDLAVARIGDRTTARRCVRDAAMLLLEPADGEHHAATLTARQAAAVVSGIVAGVVRRLRPVAEHAATASAPPV